MGIPTAEKVAHWISSEATNDEYVSLADIAFQILQSNWTNKSSEAIAEHVEIIFPDLVAELKNFYANCLADGIQPRYQISGEETDAYIKVLETKGSALLTQLRGRTPRQFEHFCKDILLNLGAYSSDVTGGSDDGGVDFIAYSLPLGSDIGPAPKSSRALVVGQAKRYTTGVLITENDVRKFIGGAIRKVYDLKKSHALVGAKTPIVYAYWTTSEFHHKAKEYVRDMGIWYLNGLGLAQLANRVGISDL